VDAGMRWNKAEVKKEKGMEKELEAEEEREAKTRRLFIMRQCIIFSLVYIPFSFPFISSFPACILLPHLYPPLPEEGED